jgi:uncharacterized protein YbcC (UPF0753/DUF2309 family)
MAPLWPLQNFVAVNPFVGLSARTFIDACDLIRRQAPGGMQMGMEFYREKFATGEIVEADLEAALNQARKTLCSPWKEALAELDPTQLIAGLQAPPELAEGEILTVAEAVERAHAVNWTSMVSEAIGQFCAAYYDAGQSAWRLPWRELPLYAAWREAASLDAHPELLGLRNFRSFVQALPDDAEAVIASLLPQLGGAASKAADFLHKELMSIRGWAGYVQYRVRENGLYGRSDDALLQLLAVRLAYDAALLAQFDGPALREFWPHNPESVAAPSGGVLRSFLWLLAHEHAWRRQLLGKLGAVHQAQGAAAQARPAVQAVFCIDVRSEIFRRALEATSPEVETIGFAGFFGLAIEYIPFGQTKAPPNVLCCSRPSSAFKKKCGGCLPEEEQAELRRQRLASGLVTRGIFQDLRNLLLLVRRDCRASLRSGAFPRCLSARGRRSRAEARMRSTAGQS